MAPPPIVTGISPKEGPPGTRVTLRGEFLGISAQDLIGVTICGIDCTLSTEWKSSNKIIARSGLCKGRGDIILTTISGGKGSSTVQFRGYHETIGPTKESAVWVEEAPVQSFAWGRRALSPNTYQQEDPLGLSVEGYDKKFPEEELNELFGEASGELSSEKFHPGWFLLQHHHATTLSDLKAGLAYLRRKVNSQKEGQLSFLKANVGSVMEQLDTILQLKEQFEADVQKYGKNPMEKLEIAINDSMSEANKLFDDVLLRRDRADTTRNALSVMQRYKFLFCMPVNIERNIKNSNYDLVINDYARVKNLFKNTEIEVFKKILKEIEYRIETLREVLRKKLEEVPTTLEDQKKIIRNLINLETEGDPAWDAIIARSNYLKKSISLCAKEYFDLEASENDRQFKSNESTPLSIKQLKLTKNDENNVPMKVQFLETLCDIVLEQLPDLWRLGQNYFSGQLHSNVNPDKQHSFKTLILTSIKDAVNSMKHCYDTNLEAPWLLHILRCVRQLYTSLIQIDLPSDALDMFAKFIFDLRLHCLMGLFKQTADNITLLNRKETWQIEYLDQEDGGITKLPSIFEQMVIEVSELAQETAIACGPREEPLLSKPAEILLYKNLMKQLFVSFTRCIQKLAFVGSFEKDHLDNVELKLYTPSNVAENKSSIPNSEQCLLISLSNVQYILEVILPKLEEKLRSLGYPELLIEEGGDSDWTELQNLDMAMFEAYLEKRSDPLIGTIEPNMYSNNFDWRTTYQPAYVKPYAREILDSIINIHAEIHHYSPKLIQRVLSHIIETVAEELARLMSCVNKQFSNFGIIQARTDILFLKKALQTYCTQRANHFFDEALHSIPEPMNKEDLERIQLLINKSTTSMRLQLARLV